jgi:hypothetical protein
VLGVCNTPEIKLDLFMGVLRHLQQYVRTQDQIEIVKLAISIGIVGIQILDVNVEI